MLGHLAFAINNKKIVRSKAQVQIGKDQIQLDVLCVARRTNSRGFSMTARFISEALYTKRPIGLNGSMSASRLSSTLKSLAGRSLSLKAQTSHQSPGSSNP